MSSPLTSIEKLQQSQKLGQQHDRQIVTDLMVPELLRDFFNWQNNQNKQIEYSVDESSNETLRRILSADNWWQDSSFLSDPELPYHLMALLLDNSICLDFFTTLMELYYFVAEHGSVGIAPISASPHCIQQSRKALMMKNYLPRFCF